ncbi:MAG: TRAP transporter large permease subunit, partial [Pseudaminobacter sp.]
MFDPAIIGILMFPVIVAVLMMGFPVAFTLAGVSLIFAGFGAIAGLVHTEMLSVIPGRIYGIMTNQVYVAIPLFIFMGVVLERSRIAEDLLETMGLLFGHMRGGLGLSVIFVGMLLAASTGVVGATVVTMGLLSLPAMLRAGYDPKLATGVICASGTLGQIIPPSTVLILLADVLQGAYAEAQTAKGNFAPEPVSVVDIFAGAFFPSLVLVGLYASWVIFNAITRKDACPALVKQGEVIEGLGLKVVKVLLPPLALIIAVLGSIIAGLATPTESAAIGSICALALAGWRGALTLDVLRSAMRSTLQISTMIYLILVGATLFSLVFRLYDGDRLVEDFLLNMPGGAFASVLFVMVVIFLLGFVLDFI